MLCYFVTCLWAGSNCISSDFYDLSSTVNEVRSPKSVSTSEEGSTLHTNIKYLYWSLLNNKINYITTSSGLLLSLLHQLRANNVCLIFIFLLQYFAGKVSSISGGCWSKLVQLRSTFDPSGGFYTYKHTFTYMCAVV